MKREKMFARRTDWELHQNRISGILSDLKKFGRSILDLTESNPTACGFSYPEKEIQNALLNSANMTYTPSSKGTFGARQAVADYYASKKINVSPEQIFLTASTSEAYSFLFRLLANPGETILFPQPSYPLFEFLVDLNDLEMEYYSLVYQDRWMIDLAELSECISIKTRGIALVNPNNPTGSYIKRSELAGLNEIARAKNLALISDEVFFDYAFEDKTDFMSLAGNEECLTFVLGGLSKTLGLPQMKLSWIIVSGPEKLFNEAMARLEIIADTYLSVNTPVQNALPVWMKLRPAIQQEIMTRVSANREFLLKNFSDLSLGSCLHAEGGWYMVLKLTDGIEEENLVEELLLKDQVYVHPGYFFNFSNESYLVVSLLPKPEVFQEGLKRIMRHLKEQIVGTKG